MKDRDFIIPAIVLTVVLILMFILLGGCATLPDELPRYVAVETAPGKLIFVAVYPQRCAKDYTGARANLDSPGEPSVYLCGHAQDEPHELAHWRGMRHTPWQYGGAAGCSTVITPGYKTRYHAGDRICIAYESRYEWIERGPHGERF